MVWARKMGVIKTCGAVRVGPSVYGSISSRTYDAPSQLKVYASGIAISTLNPEP